MKILIVLLALLLAASSPANSQIFGKKKASDAPTANPKIDSLTIANQTLTLKADSLSKELGLYVGAYTSLYSVLREKVFRYNFDPAKMSFLIDSLRGSKDAASVALVNTKLTTVSSDSLALLFKNTAILKANIDSLKMVMGKIKAIPSDEIDRVKAVSSLKQYKDLLDAKVITDAEYLTLKRKCLNDL
jgi:hypothetical protein